MRKAQVIMRLGGGTMARGPIGTAEHLISIGALAQAVGVSCRTIRYYEEIGILPTPTRSPGGVRKYPAEYRTQLEAALALKDLGFSLDEIKALAENHRDGTGMIDDKIHQLERKLTALRRLRADGVCVRPRDPA